MLIRRLSLVWILLAVATVFALAGLRVGKTLMFRALETGSYAQEAADVRPSFSSGYQGREFFDAAYDRANASSPTAPIHSPTSAIVAHHLLVADKIAEIFGTLSSDAKLVVLLSPNHFDVGGFLAQTTDGVWRTPYGALEADTEAAAALRKEIPTLREESVTFEREHGIAALTPFVRRSFPNAKLLPLVVHESLSREKAVAQGEAIARLFPDAVVIASMDMSHQQPLPIQEAHDAATQQAIADGLCATDCPKLEIDSNAALTILQAVNRARGTEHWVLTHHSSSISMGLAEKPEDNTSHILGVFLAGEPEP